jgi:hypothetical protein
MTKNLIDLDKAVSRWNLVKSDLNRIWGEQSDLVAAAVGEPAAAIRNEYFFHEAGHLLGFDIEAKMSSGYFRIGGALRWPLVYCEEVRADLHALAMAADSLPATDAAAVFMYHVGTRFGMGDSFGLVPFLLFFALQEVGLMTADRKAGRFALTAADSSAIVAGMRACGEWVSEHLTIPELNARTAIDRAMVGAPFVREARRRLDSCRLGWPA